VCSVRKIDTKLNHKGSTLLMVIICIAFIGILGALMLSVSMVNLQMKKVQNKSKDNFYSCETALEEIRAGLEELTATTIQNAYEEVLSKYVLYAALDDASRNTEIQTLVLDKLTTALGNDYGVIASGFKDYLSLPKDKFTISIQAITTQNTTTPYSLLLQGVKIIYQDQDYNTSITSDLRITLPSFTFSQSGSPVTYSMKQPYEGYALVADGGIFSENSTGENVITGNVYAGQGITVRDTGLMQTHKVTMNGDVIVTRGDITVEDTATLVIGSNTRPLLWADNIRTATTGSYPVISALATKLNLNAIVLLKDDLTLDGRNSNVVCTGAMVGYTGAHTVEGSAIMINGSGSSLDLSGLSSLVLAGRAHIFVEDSILKTITTEADINILTGESLALKSNQKAYLIPGEYIYLDNGTTKQAALHNPITQQDLLTGTPYISVEATTDSSKLNCADYINPSPYQYKIAAKQTAAGASTTLRYYYLNFASGKLADQYLVDYMNKYPQALQVMDAFTLGSVKIPSTDKMISVGNVMYYDSASSSNPVKYIPGLSSDSTYTDDKSLDDYIAALQFNNINNDSIYQNTVLLNKTISTLPDMYFNMTHILTTSATTRQYFDEDQVVASSVLRNGIAQVVSEYSAGYTPVNSGFIFYHSLAGNRWEGTDPNAKAIVVLNGDAVIAPNTYFNGFLMASGNVTIGEGAVVNGIILAAGNNTNPGDVNVMKNVKVYGRIIAEGSINLKENCVIDCTGNTTFDTSLSVNTFLEKLFNADGQLLWKLFVNPEASVNFTSEGTSADFVDISNLVSFENWRVNK